MKIAGGNRERRSRDGIMAGFALVCSVITWRSSQRSPREQLGSARKVPWTIIRESFVFRDRWEFAACSDRSVYVFKGARGASLTLIVSFSNDGGEREAKKR